MARYSVVTTFDRDVAPGVSANFNEGDVVEMEEVLGDHLVSVGKLTRLPE